MSGNTFGKLFTITTYGESHGNAIGVIIDGCPPLINLSEDDFTFDMNRRRPGINPFTSPRLEEDQVQILSGVFEGKTTGTPISLLIQNNNQKSRDYDVLKNVYRPGHADFVYQAKYGIRDYRGGGRSSARETAARVAAGVIAKKVCAKYGIDFRTWVSGVGQLKEKWNSFSIQDVENIPSLAQIEDSSLRIPNKDFSLEAENFIRKIKEEGNSVGGKIRCLILNSPIGLGEPVFDKLNSVLYHAISSINAVKAIEFGAGIESLTNLGSEYNSSLIEFKNEKGSFPIDPKNLEGGITGGISNGNIIDFTTYFKPVSSIKIQRKSVNSNMEAIDLEINGRHDACVLPRAVPIVEAMAAIVISDMLLRAKHIF